MGVRFGAHGIDVAIVKSRVIIVRSDDGWFGWGGALVFVCLVLVSLVHGNGLGRVLGQCLAG